MDYDLCMNFLRTAQSNMAQALSMLAVAKTTDTAAPVAPPPAVTTTATAANTGYVPSATNPPKESKDYEAWFEFLSDKTPKDVPGYFIGYVLHYGYPVGLAGFLMQNGSVYPDFLTHAQLLAAFMQNMPADRNIGARWDAASRMWVDAQGTPYAPPTDPTNPWAAVYRRMQEGRQQPAPPPAGTPFPIS